MGKIAFLFPGQGSQTVGMGMELAEKDEKVKAVFAEADEALNESLSTLIFNGPQEELTKTANAQPALLTTSIALLKKVQEYEITPDYVAGHSLGEYTALVAADALSFRDAVQIVRTRGELMEAAVPNRQGTMAAILGMDEQLLQSVTKEVTETVAPVQLANLNCPGQIVISGAREGVERASELAKTKGAKRAIPLDVSGPFHSSLMKPAAEKLHATFANYSFVDATIPVLSNVTAEPVQASETIRKLLIEQLYSPVQWEKSVRKMIDLGVDTFVEIGPGKVLTGLVRKIDRTVTAFSINDEASLQAAVSKLTKEGE